MRFTEMIVNAVESLLSDKLRSLLSVLGIIISVCSIILIHILGVCVANTVTDLIVEKNEYVKADFSVVPTENNKNIRVDSIGIYNIPDEVKMTDNFLQNMENEFSKERMQRIYSLEYVNTEIVKQDEEISKLSVIGCTQAYLEDSYLELVQGELFGELSQEDVNIAIVPERFLTEFCEEEDYLNHYWNYFDGNYFYSLRIVGVYVEDAYDVEMDGTIRIYTPINYWELQGETIEERLDTIQYKIENMKNIERMRKQLINYYDQYYENEDWTLQVNFDIDQRETINKYIQVAVQIVTIIGFLTFSIGAMCIMNMMVIMVDEKLTEVGIRRALGAQKRDVYIEILIEAVILVLSGVVLGVVLGCTGGYLIIRFISYIDEFLVDMNYFLIPWKIIVESVAISFVVGVIAAIGPIIKVKDFSICDILNHE